jgi:hypothetical protein
MIRIGFLVSLSSLFLVLGAFTTATVAHEASQHEASQHGERKNVTNVTTASSNKPQSSNKPHPQTGNSGGNQGGHSVKLSNLGHKPLTNIKIQFSGNDSGDFSQLNDCGKKLEKRDGCEINVIFTPKTPGPKSATMEVLTSEGTQVVGLTGTGI